MNIKKQVIGIKMLYPTPCAKPKVLYPNLQAKLEVSKNPAGIIVPNTSSKARSFFNFPLGKMKYLGLICVLLILIGCSTSETEPQEAEIPEPVQEVVEEEIQIEEPAIEERMLSVKLTKEGFEINELKVVKNSRITIINDAPVVHKLTGGDLFKEQFNTHLKSLYGNKDPIERNKLNVIILEAGEYEIKDLTSSTVLKIIAE